MKRSGKAKKSPVKRSVKKTVATPKKAAVPAKKISAKVSKPAATPPALQPSISTTPLWNIRDAGDAYKVRMTAPGLDIKNVKINIDGNKLTVSSIQENVKTSKEKMYLVKEYSYSSWSRSILLPQRVNAHDIKVRYKEGILKLDLPKF